MSAPKRHHIIPALLIRKFRSGGKDYACRQHAAARAMRRALPVALLAGLAASVALGAAGCGVSLSHDGEMAEVKEWAAVRDCRHLGSSIIEVDDITNEEEYAAVIVRARNLAGEIGADTVALKGEPDVNGQMVQLYICRR